MTQNYLSFSENEWYLIIMKINIGKYNESGKEFRGLRIALILCIYRKARTTSSTKYTTDYRKEKSSTES